MTRRATAQPSRFRSRVSEATTLWYAADYTQCLRLLEREPPSAQRFFLAAKALYRLQRPDAALVQLTRGESSFVDPAMRACAYALSAVLHQMQGRGNQARACIHRVHDAWPGAAPPAEVTLLLALWAWLSDDLEQAQRLLEAADVAGDLEAAAHAASLFARIHASRREYHAAAILLTDALRLAYSLSVPDLGLIAELLQALSQRCGELHLPEALALVSHIHEQMTWSGDLRLHEFLTLRYLAWANALYGESIAAMRRIHRAISLVPNPAWQVPAQLDQARIAFASGEVLTGQALLLDAYERAKRVDWSAAPGEEGPALLLAAELFAPFDTARARRLLDRYAIYKAQMSLSLGVVHDSGLEAMEAYTEAIVLFCSNQVAPSRRPARRAFDAFAAMNYDWRAARCAALLYRSGAGERWRQAAQGRILHYPHSCIAVELRCYGEVVRDDAQARLSLRQREILQLLRAGDSIDAVATRLGLSRNTIRVHITKIHRAFGVRNRVELLRKTAALDSNRRA